jgi:DNA repair protein RecO (recombination protein O)
MEWTDTALILRLGRFRETDMWIRLLTRKRGVVSVFAFGASRSRRRFCGCLDLLNVIHVRAKNGRNGDFLNLEEGVLLEGPRRLRQDRRRLGMVMNCARFLESAGVPPDNAQKAFDLFRGMLRLGEEAGDFRDGLPVFFRFRLAFDQGYVPDVFRCAVCGAPLESGPAFFAVARGAVYCGACAEKKGIAREEGVALSPPALGLVHRVCRDDPPAWDGPGLRPEDWRAALRLADSFVQFHLGLRWELGRFVRI